IHIKSIRNVNTYDKTPKMKVKEITDALLENISGSDFFVVNFSNGDMVGHTGNLKAAIKAVEAVDVEIGRIAKAFPGIIFITADHGNCEDMISECRTCHTTNDVPMIAVNAKGKLKDGSLADIAPTILKVMKIKKPKEMAGKNLLI
ncbi:MAG: 2,3-bisphosphoglycerate-independent phosphoglycerate mutase, partial [Nanoarchaeota archaeon]